MARGEEEVSDRLCPVCGGDLAHRSEMYRTCGRPQCVRAYRTKPSKAIRAKIEWTRPDIYAPDAQGRARVIEAWSASSRVFGTDRTTTSRVEWTAREAGVRPVEVMAITKSVAA